MQVRRPVAVIVAFLFLVLLGLAVYVVRDSVRASRDVESLETEAARRLQALAQARHAARECVRARLKREDAVAAKADDQAAARRKSSAAKRRAVARRFFGGHGFVASEEYMRAAELPKDAPSEADQEIIDLAGEAASEADLDTAAEVAAAALESADPRARIAAVEMLSGLGEAGLVDISEFLGDAHPEVANLAADRWELGIQELMDEKEQAALVKVGFLAITDADQLRSLGGTLMLVSDAKLSIGVLTDVIRNGTSKQRAAAQEAYEGVTGETWAGEAAAEAWLAENYEQSGESDDSGEPDGSDGSADDSPENIED